MKGNFKFMHITKQMKYTEKYNKKYRNKDNKNYYKKLNTKLERAF